MKLYEIFGDRNEDTILNLFSRLMLCLFTHF